MNYWEGIFVPPQPTQPPPLQHPALRPCPFCSARAAVPIQTKQGLFLVHCTYCHAEGPPRHDADDAVRQWQQRGEVNVLEYATKDEIVSELAGRADASDGLLLVYEGTDDDGDSSFQMVWRGSLTMAYGLAHRAALRLGDRCHPPRQADD